jgi:N-acetylglucosaminyldiphosphoundecaprenol N-acetyl-beta-D-mannosaminyltransferase
MSDVVARIEAAVSAKRRCLLSTANLDFVVQALSDPEFRETLLDSDICTADGMSLVWVAGFLGLPITSRVTGADLLKTLKADASQKPLKMFLFGGSDGISEAAALSINATSRRLKCVGALNPGFGRVEDISRLQFLDAINKSCADFVVASLGAKKGQLWLHRNRDRLTIPVRAHLGAAVNFVAGSIKRAPSWCQRSGLEWLWRIKEEPYLWRRYASDGLVMVRLLLTQVLPLRVLTRCVRSGLGSDALRIEMEHNATTTVRLFGEATERNIEKGICFFEQALATHRGLSLDLTNVRHIDARFLGLILLVRKALKQRQQTLAIERITAPIRRMFRLHGASFLLE